MRAFVELLSILLQSIGLGLSSSLELFLILSIRDSTPLNPRVLTPF